MIIGLFYFCTQSFNTCACADLRDEDLLALGLSLKAWPPPLLDTIEADEYDNDLRLDAVWRELGLPGLGVVDAWRADDILSFFRMQQCKVLAFTSGAHGRLGAESRVSWLDEQALMLIADGVLGGWSLFKTWGQHAVVVCDDAAGAERGGDAGAGGTIGGAGGLVEGAGCGPRTDECYAGQGRYAVNVCDM